MMLAATANYTIVAVHQIPGTNTEVTITRRKDNATDLRTDGVERGMFYVTRPGDPKGRFNRLECGRKTEAEAREAANFLWADARDRVRATN